MRADAVIVGGGIMGAATAFALARAGVRDVLLVEAGEPAGGSSGKPLGGVRAVFSDRTNIELGLRSLEFFRRFAAETGAEIGLQQVGYLFALRREEDVDRLRASVAVQNELGVRSEVVDPARARQLCPYLDERSLLAAVWSPDGGYARPTAAVLGLLRAARAHGVEVRTQARVVAVDATAAGAARVRLESGEEVATPVVVCTAGAWSREVGALAGVDLPVTPRRREIAFSPVLTPPPPAIPFTIDYATTAYFHGDGEGGLLFGWADPDQPDGFDRAVSRGWHASLRAALLDVAPALADVPLERGWAGLYEMTPDCNALVGETSAPGFRFLYACGFSGHGFLQGPAVGACLADLYRGRSPRVDVSAFTADRFRQPARRTELGII